METTTTRSIAEIEAELSAAREAEAQRKRDEQKMQEKLERAIRNRAYRRKQGALIRSLRPHMVAIQQELALLGVKAQLREGSVARNFLPTLNLTYQIAPSFVQRSTGSGFYSRYINEYNIQIGDYGDKKMFRFKKDGTYNYDKIAKEIFDRIDAARHEHERNNARKNNAATAQELAQKLALVLGGNVAISEGYNDWKGRYVPRTEPKFELTMKQMQTLLEKLDAQ